MLDLLIDTSRLEQKLSKAIQNIRRATVDGTEEAQADMIAHVDEQMFVPLKFDTDIDESARTVTSKTRVALNLRPQTRRSRFLGRRQARSRASGSRRRWYHWAREFATQTRDKTQSAIESAIRRRT